MKRTWIWYAKIGTCSIIYSCNKCGDVEDTPHRHCSSPVQQQWLYSRKLSLVTDSVTPWGLNDAAASRRTKEEIHFDCFSSWLTHCLLAGEGQVCWNIAWEGKSESADWWYFTPWMFFIACGLMNETHTIATKETEKMAIKRTVLSQFISLCNCLLLPVLLRVTHTSCWSLCLQLHLSPHLVPHSFCPSPPILSPRLHLDTWH